MIDEHAAARQRQGATLRRLRQWLGLHQREVAEALGLSPAAYAFWENGRTELRLSDVRRLAEIFEIPLATLLRSLGYEIEQDAPTLGTWMERSGGTHAMSPRPFGAIGRRRRDSGDSAGSDDLTSLRYQTFKQEAVLSAPEPCYAT